MPKVVISASTPEPSQGIEAMACKPGQLVAWGWPQCGRAAALTLAIIHALAPIPASAQQLPASPAPRTTIQTAPDPAQAKALLMRMADYLAKAPAFSVHLDAGYDVVQATGQRIEFGQTRQILLRRPNQLRISATQSSGTRQEVFYNGSELVLFDPRENVFAKLSRSGSVDDMIHYLLGELQTPVPLSGLLLTTLPQELEARITEVALVERTMIAAAPVDHLAARMPDVDLQVWISQGEQPVPLRIILTYRNAPGQPQFRAALNDWNFSPAITEADFSFVPPAGAEAVAVLVPAQPARPTARKRN